MRGELAAKKRPSVMWYKNLYTNEMEEYGGKIERTSLSLWMQDRARTKMASAPKTIEELTRFRSSEVCTRSESNYCVIAFYTSASSKQAAVNLLESVKDKYKDDPITFWTLNVSGLRDGCPIEELPREGFAVSVFRTKRNKFEDAGTKKDTLESKIEYALSGNMLANSMTSSIGECFA